MKIEISKTKIATLISTIAISIIAPVAVLAAGPADRPTFTAENPADYPSFNAITNNPVWGDERNFVRIRDTTSTEYKNEINVEVGKTYEVMMFFHNNAKSSYNTDSTQSGIAKNVRLYAQQPNELTANKKTAVTGTISSDNTNPAKVWDEAYMTSSTNVALRYVSGSAKIKTNALDNVSLPTNIFSSSGVLLGYDNLNGLVPGCTQYFGYVYYRVTVDKPAFEMSKTISSENSNTFSKKITSKSGSILDYKITYKNTGTTDQNNVTIKDTLPKGLEYIKGSTKLVNASLPQGKVLNDDLTTKGVNIGSYGPGITAEITYKVKIAEAKELSCGVNTLTNKASVITENGTKEDTADVEVTTECKPTECKPGIPEGSAECEDTVVPTELPKTGPMEAALMMIAVIAITGGVAYWYRSREEVKKATLSLGENKSDISPKDNIEDTKNDNKKIEADKKK